MFAEEVTKKSSATWGSSDGTFVMYVQYDDSRVSELMFPHISSGIGGAGATRTGFLLPTTNTSLPTVFPDHVSVRYPTVNILRIQRCSYTLFMNKKVLKSVKYLSTGQLTLLYLD